MAYMLTVERCGEEAGDGAFAHHIKLGSPVPALRARCSVVLVLSPVGCGPSAGRHTQAAGEELLRAPPRRAALRRDVVGCYAVTRPGGARWPGPPVVRLDSVPADHAPPGVWRVRVPLDDPPGWLDDAWSTWTADSAGDSVRVATPFGLGVTVTVFAGAGRPSRGRTASFEDTGGPPVEVGPVRVARVACPRAVEPGAAHALPGAQR